MLRCFKPLKEEEETSLSFLENGSSLLEELIVLFTRRYKNPIRCFSAKEILVATNSFTDKVVLRNSRCMFRGHLDDKPILVKKFSDEGIISPTFNGAIRDIVVTSQMCHLKNVLKLRGCCLEFRFPALVYEDAGTQLLVDLLHYPDSEKLLSWRSRLHIAKGVANTVAYLHSSFPTAIIYRDLKASKVIIDKNRDPKLFDFSLSIPLPPGKSHVEDLVMGTVGYIEPEYLESGILTKKTDVYSFGVLLLVLLTGEEALSRNHGREKLEIVDYVKHHMEKDQFIQNLDPVILADKEVRKEQLESVLNLAMKCTQERGEDRPDMIEISKELLNIERCSGHC